MCSRVQSPPAPLRRRPRVERFPLRCPQARTAELLSTRSTVILDCLTGTKSTSLSPYRGSSRFRDPTETSKADPLARPLVGKRVTKTELPSRARGLQRKRALGWLILSTIVAAFLGSGLYVQSERLRTWRPVQAIVVSRDITFATGRHREEADEPLVTYRYQVNGIWHTANRFFPAAFSGGTYVWASRMAHQYNPGDTTTAYVDPSDPAQAFLVHEPDIPTIPVIWLIVALSFAALLAAWRLRTLGRANSQV
jgi:hypothetical protein